MILVIDDDEGMRSLICAIIRHNWKIPIHNFVNPADAVSFFKENHNDVVLVLSDYEMPEMNGCELIEKLKRINSKVRMGLISGLADDKGIFTKEHCPSADFSISKPFETRELAQKIEEQLKN